MPCRGRKGSSVRLKPCAAGEVGGGGRKSKRSLLEVMADLEREGVLSSSQGLGYSTSIGGSGEAGVGSARGSGEFPKVLGGKVSDLPGG